MSIKKWLVAIGIIGVLAAAFFWGGNSPRSTSDSAARLGETQAIPTAVSTVTPDREGAKEQGTATSPTPSENNQQKDIPQLAESAKPNQETAKPPTTETSKHADQAVSTLTATTNPAMETATPSAQPTPAPTKDKFQTEPVPDGKPKPTEWQDVTVNKKKTLTATLSVTCKTILTHMSSFNKDKLEVLPADGVIYPAQKVTFFEGESVFDVLLREMKKNKIHMEFSMTPIYNSNYIEGIHNIYEFDCGELSGWMYKVNGWFPNYGASRYMLKDGDVIDWVYTCDLGRDIGGDQAGAGGRK
ncbi:hypothetical protein A8709_11445 [Paenibacillus pectinilyticus]|uniref:Transcobalamin-like C-terminal domain-containing protein n=1 Tax=Paenibacillus pectinilyticus TaxID=512399 RepID=A0A1C1A2T6_9BACL|nr:DUF4430 domain-containing protein [Paenibacillus pectinilyticus]OCT14849.1 hypothetical protein A8709_11445 [Paenibacillus pectinilyticus]